MEYPRILIVVMGRINAADNANNGLLLRNLFGQFPRQNLAQIYSGGDNGDEGFFGRYYQLKPQDRKLGRLFFRLKSMAMEGNAQINIPASSEKKKFSFSQLIRRWGKKLLMDSGLFEIIFRPRLSQEMILFIKDFEPDIIFSQGYNLGFALLPLMITQKLDIPIVYYPTDDWSKHRKKDDLSTISYLTYFARQYAAKKLVNKTKICIAFNRFMQEEYLLRYKKKFLILMQGDESRRFDKSPINKLCESDCYWIVATGDFDRHRIPLLYDLDSTCKTLNGKGLKVKATVFPVNYDSLPPALFTEFDYISFLASPDHHELAGILHSADVLFLLERFDETSSQIRMSISSKAHLFMHSGRPIIVYSHPITGIARYALEEKWAEVIDRPDAQLLADVLEKIFTDKDKQDSLISSARKIALKNHDLPSIQKTFYAMIQSIVHKSNT